MVDYIISQPAENDVIITVPEIYLVLIQIQKLQKTVFSQVHIIRCASDLMLFKKCYHNTQINKVVSYDETYNRLDWLVNSEIKKSKPTNINRIFYDGLSNTTITFKKATFYSYLKYIFGVIKNELMAHILRREISISHLRAREIFRVSIVQFNTGNVGYRFKIPSENSIKPNRINHKPLMSLKCNAILILLPLRNKFSKKQFWKYIIKMIDEDCFGKYSKIYIKQHPRCMDTVKDNGPLVTVLDKYLPLEFIELNKATVVLHHSSSKLNGTENILNLSILSKVYLEEIFGNYIIFKNYILQNE